MSISSYYRLDHQIVIHVSHHSAQPLSSTVVLNVLGLKLLHLYILDEYVSYMLALTESVTI